MLLHNDLNTTVFCRINRTNRFITHINKCIITRSVAWKIQRKFRLYPSIKMFFLTPIRVWMQPHEQMLTLATQQPNVLVCTHRTITKRRYSARVRLIKSHEQRKALNFSENFNKLHCVLHKNMMQTIFYFFKLHIIIIVTFNVSGWHKYHQLLRT